MAPKRRLSSRVAGAEKQYAEEGSSDDEPSDEELEEAEAVEVQKKPAKVQGPPRKRGKTTKGPAADIGEATLLDIVVKHSSSIPLAAKECINRYRESKAATTAEILSLLVQAGGSDTALTAEEVEDGEVDRLVQSLITSVSREGYLDLFKAKGVRNFKEHYLEMWDNIIREAHAQELLLGDDYLLDKVSHLIIGLNCSVVRSFRYTATVTACQVVTSLVRVILALTEARETAVRQKEAEEKKKGGKERAQAFQRTISACQRQIQGARDVIANLFQAVTAHRFRDVAEDIRAVVIAGIGAWIKLHPAEFLQDNYLKYIAWALSDKDASVREAAIDALLALYSVPDHLSPLHDFTDRFKKRFCELIYDINDGVAIKGVQLVTTLVKVEEVEPDAVREVYRLLVDTAAGLRHAAADLVADLLEEQGARFLATQQKRTPQKGRKKAAASQAEADKKELQLAGVLHIMHLLGSDAAIEALVGREKKRTDSNQQPLDPVLVSLVVEALSDGHRVEILGDWRALADALLDDGACERRGRAATTNLALLLRESLDKAAAPGGHVGEGGGPKGGRGRAGAAAAGARQEATLALIQALPKLLRKFQTDAATVAPLAALVQRLKLEVYSLKREEGEHEALLGLLADLALKQREDDAISECLASLHHCATEGPDTLRERGQAVWNSAATKITSKAETAVKELLALSDKDLQEAADEDEEEACEEAHAARAALLRVHHVLLLAPPGSQVEKVIKSLQKLLAEASKGRAIPPAVLEQAILAMPLLLLWKLKAAEEAGAGSPSSSPRGLTAGALGKTVGTFMDQLNSIVENSPSERVRDAAFCTFCDLIIVFDPEKLDVTGMSAAGFRTTDAMVENMWAQCEDILAREMPSHDDLEEPTEAYDAACAHIVDAQVKALTAVARLVAFEVLPNWEDLAAGVLSHLAGHDKRVCEVARDLHRRLKTNHSQRVPVLLLAALQVAFLRLLAASSSPAAVEQFRELCGKVAALHVPPAVTVPGSLLILVQRCLDFIAQDVEERLDFFQGLSVMVQRLPKDEADGVLKKAEAMTAATRAGRSDGPWAAFTDFLAVLQDRIQKGRGQGGATPGTHVKRGPRRAPLPSARTGRNSDSELSDAEEIEEDMEEGTAPVHDDVEDVAADIATPTSSGPAWRSARKGRGAATRFAAATKPSRGRPAPPPEENGDDSDGVVDGDEEELEDEMPPEEALPQPAKPAARQRVRAKAAREVTRVYADEGSDGGTNADQEMEDADLLGVTGLTSPSAAQTPAESEDTGGAPLRNIRRRR